MKTLNENGLKKLIPYLEESLGVKGKFVIHNNTLCLSEDRKIQLVVNISDDMIMEEPVGVVSGMRPPPSSVDSGAGVKDNKDVNITDLNKKVDKLTDFAKKAKKKLSGGNTKDLLKKAFSDIEKQLDTA